MIPIDDPRLVARDATITNSRHSRCHYAAQRARHNEARCLPKDLGHHRACPRFSVGAGCATWVDSRKQQLTRRTVSVVAPPPHARQRAAAAVLAAALQLECDAAAVAGGAATHSVAATRACVVCRSGLGLL